MDNQYITIVWPKLEDITHQRSSSWASCYRTCTRSTSVGVKRSSSSSSIHPLQHTCCYSSCDRNSRLLHLSRKLKSRNRQAVQNCVQIPISLRFLSFEAFEKVCNGGFLGCLESNSSSSGTGCKWSVSVSRLEGGKAESRNRPLNPEEKIFQSCT